VGLFESLEIVSFLLNLRAINSRLADHLDLVWLAARHNFLVVGLASAARPLATVRLEYSPERVVTTARFLTKAVTRSVGALLGWAVKLNKISGDTVLLCWVQAVTKEESLEDTGDECLFYDASSDGTVVGVHVGAHLWHLLDGDGGERVFDLPWDAGSALLVAVDHSAIVALSQDLAVGVDFVGSMRFTLAV